MQNKTVVRATMRSIEVAPVLAKTPLISDSMRRQILGDQPAPPLPIPTPGRTDCMVPVRPRATPQPSRRPGSFFRCTMCQAKIRTQDEADQFCEMSDGPAVRSHQLHPDDYEQLRRMAEAAGERNGQGQAAVSQGQPSVVHRH